MSFTDTRIEVQPTQVATVVRTVACPIPAAPAAPSGQERHRWAGGKPPSEREREILAARRARKRAA